MTPARRLRYGHAQGPHAPQAVRKVTEGALIAVSACCLAALVVSCGTTTNLVTNAKSATPASPAASASPSRAQLAADYIASLRPIYTADLASAERLRPIPADTSKWPQASKAVRNCLHTFESIQVALASVHPPSGFREAHQKLIHTYDVGYDGFQYMLQNLESKTPPSRWLNAVQRNNRRILKANYKFRVTLLVAAHAARVKVPAKLLKAYPID
jgi:hypothetical protein